MGIITRLLHRSEGLSANRFNAFLFDTGENIHLHYRDLRVEFSVEEFLEFHDLCQQYLPQLKQFIDSGYRDGVHPNTNQASTWRQFTTRKPLKNSIQYHPTRISLEENSDGYHVHIRNYKILLDKPSFLALVRGARDALEKRETDIDVPEALELLTVNELPNRVDKLEEASEGWQAEATVERAYFRKACQVLDAVGFHHTGSRKGSAQYRKGGASISIRPGRLVRPAGPALNLLPLDTYLKEHAAGIDAEEFTRIKLQILDAGGQLERQGRAGSAELHHSRIFYDASVQKVVLPARLDEGAQSARDCLIALDRFAAGLGVRASKPPKLAYSEDEQDRLELAFDRFLRDKIVCHPCVKAVYRFGDPRRGKPPGVYELPYVHFDWVKLGSDFDLLIEIDERHPVPGEWDRKFHWEPAGSGYYHLGDVDHPIASPFIEEYPGIDFRHHLVEAYVFLPSRGDVARKDEFLAKHSGRCVYSRDAASSNSAETAISCLTSAFGLAGNVSVTSMPSPGFNTFYRVMAEGGDFVAKLMDRRDFTPALTGHRGNHLAYEAEILGALRSAGSRVAVLPVVGRDGGLLQELGERMCMLFPFIDSDPVVHPSTVHIDSAAAALAGFHSETSELPEGLGAYYQFGSLVDYELAHLRSGLARSAAGDAHQQLRSVLAGVESLGQAMRDGARLGKTHCHGDVCPRNFFFTRNGAILHDYQMLYRGPRLMDVAEGALEFAHVEGSIDPARVSSFIDAYGRVNKLSDAEVEYIPLFLVLQCAFRLSRLLRVSLDFGYQLNEARMRAFCDYALCLLADANAERPAADVS